MPLSTNQKKHLKGLCHQLQPTVTVADKGLTPTVGDAIEEALAHHELIKVKLRQDRDQRKETYDQIIEATGAEAVMSVGGIVCIYRENQQRPVDKRLKLPKA